MTCLSSLFTAEALATSTDDLGVVYRHNPADLVRAEPDQAWFASLSNHRASDPQPMHHITRDRIDHKHATARRDVLAVQPLLQDQWCRFRPLRRSAATACRHASAVNAATTDQSPRSRRCPHRPQHQPRGAARATRPQHPRLRPLSQITACHHASPCRSNGNDPQQQVDCELPLKCKASIQSFALIGSVFSSA